MTYFQKLPILKKIIASIVVRILLGLAETSVVEAENVEISAHANLISRNEVELTVEAAIVPGIHIYGIDQLLPILATRILVDANDAIESIGPFDPISQPKRYLHKQLGIEVIEHFDRAQWRTRIALVDGKDEAEISGAVGSEWYD